MQSEISALLKQTWQRQQEINLIQFVHCKSCPKERLDAADVSYLISSMSRSSRFAFVLLRSSISADIVSCWFAFSASVELSFCFSSSQTFCAAKCASSALNTVEVVGYCSAWKHESWMVNPPADCICQSLDLICILRNGCFILCDMDIFFTK